MNLCDGSLCQGNNPASIWFCCISFKRFCDTVVENVWLSTLNWVRLRLLAISFFWKYFFCQGGKPLVGQIKLQIQTFRYSTSRSSSLRYPRGKGLGFVMWRGDLCTLKPVFPYIVFFCILSCISWGSPPLVSFLFVCFFLIRTLCSNLNKPLQNLSLIPERNFIKNPNL